MTRIKNSRDAWPESGNELLALIQRFEMLQKKHSREYALSLSIFCVPASRTEINAVLKADYRLVAAGELVAKKLDFWSEHCDPAF